MSGRFKLVVTSHCVTQRLHEADDNFLSKVEPPKKEMATLDIPSLPSSDLNHMLTFVMSPTRTPQRVWPRKTYVEDEGDRSPEPRTPNFGATPSFAESNTQFGFTFPTTSSKPDRKPETVSVQSKAITSDIEYSPVPDNSQSSPVMNIPTTVMDKVGESSKNSRAEELPTVLLSIGDGKPASFIRFLNEPIPLNTVNLEPEEVNIDKYRTPEDGYQISADLDAIHRMEEEPQETTQITSDQCVPSSSGVQYYEVISDDSSAPSQHDLLEDVAAYQSVDDTPTYTELQPRALSDITDPETISEPMSISDSSAISILQTGIMAEPMTVSEAGAITSDPQSLYPETQPPSGQLMEENVEKLNKEITKDLEAALQLAPQETKMQILLKNELKHKIQMKRLQQGKEMLQVSFDNRPIGEPSEEEKEKAHSRKMKNRESAVRSRQRRQDLMEKLDKEVKMLERENKKLFREIQDLKEENCKMESFRCDCMKNGQLATDPSLLFPSSRSQLEDERSQQTLREAIANLLAAEGKT